MKSFVRAPIQVGKGLLYANPGAGPVDGGTAEDAGLNVHLLCHNCGFSNFRVEAIDDPQDVADGRFSFQVWVRERCATIRMPGLPQAKVQYLGEPGQNIWDYPRLYVNGHSWVWLFAIDMLKDSLQGEY